METEIKEMFDEVKTALGDNTKMKSAIGQLEEQMRGMEKTLENKVAAIRRTAWDDRGNYRGVFGHEDDARAFGLFVMAHVGNDKRAMDALNGEMKSVIERALGGTTDLGDSVVPVEYSRRIQRLVESHGVFPQKAFPMPMTSDQLTFSRRTSGFTVYKTGHNVAATASDMGFETINLNADEWNALALYPKALDEDAAGAIGELVAIEIAWAFAYTLDLCGFVGNGLPAHLDVSGITTRLLAINGVDNGGGLALASGNAWSEIVEDDISLLISLVPQFAGAQNEMYCSSQFFWQVLAPIIYSKGGVTRAEFESGPGFQYEGFKVNPVQVMPKVAANSHIPLLFGDVRLSSTHGQRKELMIEESRDVKFIERQVAVLGTQRHAVNNHSLGDATNAGPVVGLITAAG